MARWRELGEVPDSDDDDDFGPDSFPGELVLDQLLASTQTHPAKPAAAAPKSVWDLPNSSPLQEAEEDEEIQNGASTKTPRDTSSSQVPRFTSSFADTRQQPPFSQSTLSSLTSPSPSPDEGVIQGENQDALPRDREFDHSESINKLETNDAARPEQQHTDQISSPTHEGQLARQAAIRYERSLRPRRPIQEHPYSLENAQYTTALRQHGVKPVRVQVEADIHRRQQQDEDSQEQDYQEDSQEVAQDGDQDMLQESQAIPTFDEPFAEALDERDPFRFPSSSESNASTPRTSPKRAGGRSSGPSSANRTDITSVLDEDDDLPSLAEFLSKPVHSDESSTRKRRLISASSMRRKRLRTNATAGPALTSSPTPHSPPRFRIPGEPAVARPKTISDHQQTPERDLPAPISSPIARGRLVVDLTRNHDSVADDLAQPQTPLSTDDESDGGLEAIRTVAKRIKGVLPASWIRLDQKTVPKARPGDARQRLEEADIPAQRRGVAQPRRGVAASRTHQIMFDDSDSDAPPSTTSVQRDIHYTQTRLELEETERQSDDEIMEDNRIEIMRPPRPRQTSFSIPSDMESSPPRMTSTKPPKPSNQRMRQPKIMAAMSNSESSTSAKHSRPKSRKPRSGRSSAPKQARSTPKPPATPPKLSILDVIGQDAPRFVRIAARVVKRRRNLGKSSPNKKLIRLATRQDNVDALSVIQDWRNGKIQPSVRQPNPASTSKTARPPLRESSGNEVRYTSPKTDQTSKSSSINPRKFTKEPQTPGQNEPARYKSRDSAPVRAVNGVPSTTTRGNDAFRPAQLETEQGFQHQKVIFNRQKRALDSLFRQAKRSEVPAPRSVDNSQLDTREPLSSPLPVQPVENQGESPVAKHRLSKRRLRKRAAPVQVDLTEAQYQHADEPLPSSFLPQPATAAPPEANKLHGLGPFGTQYTHHFDVFPFRQGVFFHESTLLGSGVLAAISDERFVEKLRQTRPRTAFILGEQTLRWSSWDDQVSSEFGIVVDWISEQIHPRVGSGSEPDMGAVCQAARFLLNFVQNSLNFSDDMSASAFVARLLETFSGFQARFHGVGYGDDLVWTDGRAKPLVEVYLSLICVLLGAVQICRRSDALYAELFAVEQLLQKMSESCIRHLLDKGISSLHTVYDEQQRQYIRDKGIREDEYVAHAWAVIMRVLETCQIPRGSFWEVTYSTMGQAKLKSSSDAGLFEHMWRTLFTLLPLSEFDNSGILRSGIRHTLSMDGWRLPQEILRRVFKLYNENTRQSSGFNSYCRALVGRCLYLAKQWGWTACNGIIGIIFDFFGSHGLEHLRNEEVSKSPRFLSLLASDPPLLGEPEDPCFHIFLKLLAVALKRLGEVGLVRDAQNLVTRTMPNHNRQYLKEQTVYQHDLAALRNHHDLLCTLFWAAPPEARPSVQTIQDLVVPASSHKEACLLNLRAWSQLARFVAASAEDVRDFRPFVVWQNSVFRQMLEQYDGVASDVQQQFLALSIESRQSISSAERETVVLANKAAVFEILRFSVKATEEVSKQSRSLEMATLAVNDGTTSWLNAAGRKLTLIVQLCLVLKRFGTSSPDMDWTILHAALTTLDHYLDRLDRHQSEASQTDSYQTNHTSPSDEAIMVG